MLDRPVRKVIDPWLESPAAVLAALRISANTVTVGGFVLGMGGCLAIYHQQYRIALTLILLNRLADGLDGCVARRSGSTDTGGFLDFVLDMIFYGGVPFSFALVNEQYLLPALFLVYSFLGTTGSFLAYAVISAKRGVTSDAEGKKSFYYSVGLMEGTETVIFFVLFCLLPEQFAMLAWIFGGLCWLTILLRLVTALIAFSAGNTETELENSQTESFGDFSPLIIEERESAQ
ncbi:MAG: CDP-alcohol phosphatidyltransferase family protein [Planctomycetota bacterium]